MIAFARSVHPHIRGAYSPGIVVISLQHGSSPHTWGIHNVHQVYQVQRRFIPTYVGHTAPARADRNRSGRFIPTYVGHTEGDDAKPAGYTVHPHIRGAYFSSTDSGFLCCGSSPHTWGILLIMTSAVMRWWFIPTYVGHTRVREYFNSFKTVHPHIRGAYPLCIFASTILSGSSPHTWGILLDSRSPWSAGRFIPTYVGHTRSFVHCNEIVRFIPTYVGHTDVLALGPVAGHGSSPHTWGIRGCTGAAGGLHRFIPTYVGHTSIISPPFLPVAVHPHIRGAYRDIQRFSDGQNGSSPHTWGIQGHPAL